MTGDCQGSGAKVIGDMSLIPALIMFIDKNVAHKYLQILLILSVDT